MSQKYEFVFLIDPNIKKERQEEIFNRLESTVEKAGAEVAEKEEWGEKRLAYPMEDIKDASFWIWHLDFDGAGFDFSSVTTYLNRQDDILRYLLLTERKE